eukprot:6184900-Pleurochrysis_carterae.AAC.8
MLYNEAEIATSTRSAVGSRMHRERAASHKLVPSETVSPQTRCGMRRIAASAQSPKSEFGSCYSTTLSAARKKMRAKPVKWSNSWAERRFVTARRQAPRSSKFEAWRPVGLADAA